MFFFGRGSVTLRDIQPFPHFHAIWPWPFLSVIITCTVRSEKNQCLSSFLRSQDITSPVLWWRVCHFAFGPVALGPVRSEDRSPSLTDYPLIPKNQRAVTSIQLLNPYCMSCILHMGAIISDRKSDCELFMHI